MKVCTKIFKGLNKYSNLLSTPLIIRGIPGKSSFDGEIRSAQSNSQAEGKHYTKIGRGEQVTEHYLPGAGTNCERKKI